ncbi:MAG: M42 family peptidase [Anaerolineales bacterium]|nr:M42 family peptidase [Anaerolineales bacterium]
MAKTSKQKEYQPPRIGPAQIRLLERLCKANAVSGDEGEIRKIVREQVQAIADEIIVDALGNMLVTRRGKEKQPLRVMLAAHMDEVGLMITHDEGDGIYRFEIVGGLSPSILAGKPVWVGKDHTPGVIGFKPIHLTDADERKRPIALDTLRIDVGPAANVIKVGDRAVFATPFVRLGPSLCGKAMDNRLGVATLIELLKNAPNNIDLLAAFTVQEEIGLRGARVAAYAFDPQLAIVLDSTPARDLPAWDDSENSAYNTRLGAGPAIYVADAGTLSDPRLIRHMVNTAEALGIPYQIRQPGSGGTDAGAIHKQRSGIPSISVSVPGRYHHTPAAIIRLSDWKNELALIHAALTRLNPLVLSGERA